MLRRWNLTVAWEVERIWLISQTVLPSEAQRRISSSVGVRGLPHRLRRFPTALGTVSARHGCSGPLINLSPVSVDAIPPFGFLRLTGDINIESAESYITNGLKA